MKKVIAVILSIMLVIALTFQAAAISSIAVKSIKLSSTNITLKNGQTSNLKVTFSPANTTQKGLTYTTGNKKIITVDNKGRITAVGEGTTAVTVASTSNKKVFAKCNVIVQADPLAKYAPNPKKTYDIVIKSGQITPTDEAQNWVIPGIKKDMNVKVHSFPGDNKPENLDIKVAAGAIPDVMLLTNAQFAKYVSQGILAEVPVDLIKKYTQTVYGGLQKVLGESAFTYTTYNGKNYGFPYVNLNNGYVTPIIWRDDWLKNVGIKEVPKTLAETETALYAIVKGDPTKTGKKVYGISDLGMNPIFGAFGGIPTSNLVRTGTGGMWEIQGNKLAYSAIQPYMKAALTLLAKWYKDGIIDPEFILGENTKGYWGESQPFTSGKIAMTNIGVWYHVARPVMSKGANLEPTSWSSIEPPFLKANPNGHYEIAQAPVGATGKQGVLRTNAADGSGIFFSKKSVDADPSKLGKMLQLCEYFNKDYDTYLKMWFGIEGKSYKIDPKTNIPTAIDSDKKYSDITVLLPLIGANFFYGFNYDVSLKIGGSDLQWAKNTFSYTKNYANPKLFTTPSESKYWGDLWKLQDKTFVSIITGDEPVSAFDDFVKQWNAQGGAIITKEANDIWATMK